MLCRRPGTIFHLQSDTGTGYYAYTITAGKFFSKATMKKTFLITLSLLLIISVSLARPFKSPVIDGNIIGDGTDWDYDDLRVDDPLGDSSWGPNDIDNLWATYDSLNLYIGVRYQVNNNAMMIMVDAGTGTGTSDINNIDWYPRNFNFPDSLLCEFLIANWNGGQLGVRRVTGDTSTEDITSLCQVSNGPDGNFFYEAEIKIPWDVIYQSGAGAVNENASVRLVSLIAGGDNWNGPDSAPDNPGMDGSGSPTTIYNMYNLPVDADGNGMPDPFRGSISGYADLEDPADNSTVINLSLYYQGDENLIEQTETDPGGGEYTFSRLKDETYMVRASAPGYATINQSGLALSGQEHLTGVDFMMTRAGKITGELDFSDGPGNDATVAAYDSVTGVIAGQGAVDIPASGGSFELEVPDGTYYVVGKAPGYVPDTTMAVIESSDSVHVGTVSLGAVRATDIILVDENGEEIPSVSTTVSFPDSGIYFYAAARLEARDDQGRLDLFDPAGILDEVKLRATKLNNYSPPRGNITFYDSDTVPLPDSTISITEGTGEFLMTDDAIEVLRIFTESGADSVWARFKLGIRSAEPEFVSLNAFTDTIVADNSDEATIEGQLLDISGNPVQIAGINVSFSVAASSTGEGSFKIPSVVTTAEGKFSATLTATGAGQIDVTASCTYNNRELEVLGEDGEDYVSVTAVAGDPSYIVLSSESARMGLEQSMDITAQLVDANGNPVSEGGYSLSFSHTPPEAGTIQPSFVDLGSDGSATVSFNSDTIRSAVSVTAQASPSIQVEGISFLIEEIVLFSDPPAPEPDPAHNSISQMDLTDVSLDNDSETLNIKADFSSNFSGVHLIVLLETGYNGSSYGGTDDPFGFPVSYEHPNKPDFALTYKYSSDDYADLRFWDGEWIWWDDGAKEYRDQGQGWVEGVNIQSSWITKGAESVDIRIPLYIFNGMGYPDSIGVELYITQEEDTKRSAFDSAPHDSTLDIDFDPSDPEADWSITETPVALNHYADRYPLDLEFPTPPELSNPTADPAAVTAGGTVTFMVDVTDAGDGIGDVLLDLSPLGGSRFQRMVDDGTNGDASAGDGTYSHLYMVDPQTSSGEYRVNVSARDGSNISSADTTISFTVEGTVTMIRAFADSTGDDHGPNLFGRDGLYYFYPTNSVFVNGAFDIRSCRIFETTKIVGGEVIPSFAFEVTAGSVPDPADEGTADWNPLYADINIQKVDIYIDAFKGGATEGLPNRQNDFARWDAWDYAIVMEGWYKGVIASEGRNTPDAWASSVKKSDQDIVLITDFEKNTITGIVSKEALGNPTVEDIQNWDIMVVMTSHDGHSDNTNFGDTRWVNESTGEWQFGGGDNSDRDPNIIDLSASPGLGKNPGKSQSEMLNYKTPAAVARSEEGETAAILETTVFEDQGPPVITVRERTEETVPFIALINSPLYFTAEITDDDEVSSATFSWRPDSATGGDWPHQLEMGYAGREIWSVDLPVEQLEEEVPIALYDSTRNIEFIIEAEDPSGNTAITPLYTMEIPPSEEYYQTDSLSTENGISVMCPEGTFIDIPAASIPTAIQGNPVYLKLTPHYLKEFNRPPGNVSSVNVMRTIGVRTGGGEELEEFREAINISLHYPQYSIENIDENLLGVYRYNHKTGRWIYQGGNVNPYGNLITIRTQKPGTFGIFHSPEFKYAPAEVFSGITFSPNPFSPNADGVYDETNISFFLTEEATVTIEIFDIEGNRIRRLIERSPFTAEDSRDNRPRRITGISWDGRNNMGNTVPFGIYICRFTVTYQLAGGERTIRKNKAVAVVR